MRTRIIDDLSRAIALLRSVHSDIEAMRSPDTTHYFGGFPDYKAFSDFTDYAYVEWPNLSITSREIGKFLAEQAS